MKRLFEILTRLDLKAVLTVYLIVLVVILGVSLLNYHCALCTVMHVMQAFIILSLLAVIGLAWLFHVDIKNNRI